MIIRLMDKQAIRVTDKQAQQVSDMIDNGVEWIILPELGRIRTHQIVAIEKERGAYIEPKQPQLPAPTTELTDEQREHNLAKIAEMREKFANRKKQDKPPVTEREWR